MEGAVMTSAPDILQKFGNTSKKRTNTSSNDYGHLVHEVAENFEKHFQFQQTEGSRWQLPPVKELYSEYYQLEGLQELKAQLNGVKSKLNDYTLEDWSLHTRRMDPAGHVQWVLKNHVGVELATVAWCKIYECLNRFPLVKGPKLNTLHLCEAPGAFIAALNHYLYSTYKREEVEWNWLATTYNPYYEGNELGKMIIDDRFILYTLDRWLFHEDFTGNIISRTNIENLQRQCEQRLHGGVQFITADGSVDCVEAPDYQEEFVALLHFAEMYAALSILAEGGCFVLKLFTLFEAVTVSKIFLLNCVFEEVHVFKPATSKRGNSENYIVCLGFKKNLPNFAATLELMKSKLSEGEHVLPMFRRSHLPRDFLLQHEACARRFMNLQINAIQTNIYFFELNSRAEERWNQRLRSIVAKEYIRRYNIKSLPEELKVLYKCRGNLPKSINAFIYRGSYAERKCLENTTAEQQIFMQRGALNELEKLLSGRYGILLQETENATKQERIELKLYRGDPFDTLYSSLFAAVQVLLMRRKLLQLLHSDPLQQAKPTCRLLSDKSIENELIEPSWQISRFSDIQRDFMSNILLRVLLKRPQKVIFTNFAFLTHLTVSVLRYLSLNCFQQFCISTDPVFEITMQNCAYDEETMKRLEGLQHKLQQDSHLWCVVDIVQLHCNEFCSALTEFNNLLLLNTFKKMLH